jgi:hypothetical protein
LTRTPCGPYSAVQDLVRASIAALERCLDVDGEDEVEALRRGLLGRAAGEDTGVVHKHVDIGCGLRKALHVVEVREIGDEPGLASLGLDLGDGLVTALLVATGHDHLCAMARHGAAYT